MGCGSSSEDIFAQKKGKGAKKKGKKPNNKGKDKRTDDDDDEEDDPPVVIIDAKPDILRKDIAKAYKAMTEKRDRLRPQLRPFLGERRGLNALLEEERVRLMTLLETKTALEEEKQALLDALFNRDAEELFKAYESGNKEAYVTIFTCRTRWQLNELNKVYESKYNEPMYVKMLNDGSKLLGGKSNLCKLLYFRIQDPAERDSQLLREFTKGMSIQDENLLEVVMTRSNAELRDALEMFTNEYGTQLKDVLAGHSYKNYRDFMTKVLECQRDERNEPYDDSTARSLADALYHAGAGRTIGIQPEPFINILANVSKAQFDSINEMYKEKKLLKDIDAKLGGDFAQAVKIRCTDKYEYLASRLSIAFKSFSVDKDMICRILGCITRWECVKVREAYDKADYGRTLDAALKVACSSEPNFLRALQLLGCGDLTMTPLGSDKELGEDERDVANAGARARKVALEQYDKQGIFEKGDKLRKSSDTLGGLEDDIPYFEMDDRTRTNDVVVLSAALKELDEVKNQLDGLKETVKDEIIAIRESYFAISSHCYETETWIGLLRAHIRALRDYEMNRGKETAKLLQTQKSIRR